jgi:hypothetical protein
MSIAPNNQHAIPAFERQFLHADEPIMRIGQGEIGGKAHGLLRARDILRQHATTFDAAIDINVPQMVVLATDVFDLFLDRNNLRDLALNESSDVRIANAFQRAALPTEITGDLRAIVEEVRVPLAVRSSSLLEDALFRPFAGVYETKMTPNNQYDPDLRFRKLVEAVKFVWASTFFTGPKAYVQTTDRTIEDERMAVIIQEVVGRRYHERFYPHLSGVCRSYNYYPAARSTPEEGVVSLALGLGKTIVDGGVCWSYAPARPHLPPPFASARDQLHNTQHEFWAINMQPPSVFDPNTEMEYLVKADLADAEHDGALRYLASTYNAASDRLSPGIGGKGPRVLNFAPLLELRQYGVNDVLRSLLAACEQALEVPVEIEFAMTFPEAREDVPPRLGFLQVRPMVISEAHVDLADEDMCGPEVVAASHRVLGNGAINTIRDIVYVKPQPFHARHTRAIAMQIEQFNRTLFNDATPYLLMGFGRWGSSDPWLGIPVTWSQICGTKCMVETTLPDMHVELSQGSHFFHNLSSFEVCYFMIPHHAQPGIHWDWLDAQPIVRETEFVRHARLDAPLSIKVDGTTGRGVILRSAEAGP